MAAAFRIRTRWHRSERLVQCFQVRRGLRHSCSRGRRCICVVRCAAWCLSFACRTNHSLGCCRVDSQTKTSKAGHKSLESNSSIESCRIVCTWRSTNSTELACFRGLLLLLLLLLQCRGCLLLLLLPLLLLLLPLLLFSQCFLLSSYLLCLLLLLLLQRLLLGGGSGCCCFLLLTQSRSFLLLFPQQRFLLALQLLLAQLFCLSSLCIENGVCYERGCSVRICVCVCVCEIDG
mmetsp:Transcript_8576/g.23160  ORF Transcript_8576/g.23160 Transcript_8576/m.23160 type:complete len:233 (-) Transcript_8576:241-939(-)